MHFGHESDNVMHLYSFVKLKFLSIEKSEHKMTKNAQKGGTLLHIHKHL